MAQQKIYLVDDDHSVRKGISLLLRSAGYEVDTFNNTTEFFEMKDISASGCILMDVMLDGESGLELQDAIKGKFSTLPIIYISGHGDIPMSVQALRKGALNFLQKPVDQVQLMQAVNEALEHSRSLVESQVEKDRIKSRIDSLTSRELEIFRLVIKGMLNKQIAADLNIAEHTVKLHRGKITEKLGVKSVPEMVYMAEKLNVK